MLVIIRDIWPSPGFSALLELDESGQLVRIKGESRHEEEHFAARVQRLWEVAGGPFEPQALVSWLSGDNRYCHFQVLTSGDFDSVYREAGMMNFVAGTLGIPVLEPEDVSKHLGEPDKHWKKGYSACELATSWVSSGDIPASVRSGSRRLPGLSRGEP